MAAPTTEIIAQSPVEALPAEDSVLDRALPVLPGAVYVPYNDKEQYRDLAAIKWHLEHQGVDVGLHFVAFEQYDTARGQTVADAAHQQKGALFVMDEVGEPLADALALLAGNDGVFPNTVGRQAEFFHPRYFRAQLEHAPPAEIQQRMPSDAQIVALGSILEGYRSTLTSEQHAQLGTLQNVRANLAQELRDLCDGRIRHLKPVTRPDIDAQRDRIRTADSQIRTLLNEAAPAASVKLLERRAALREEIVAAQALAKHIADRREAGRPDHWAETMHLGLGQNERQYLTRVREQIDAQESMYAAAVRREPDGVESAKAKGLLQTILSLRAQAREIANPTLPTLKAKPIPQPAQVTAEAVEATVAEARKARLSPLVGAKMVLAALNPRRFLSRAAQNA